MVVNYPAVVRIVSVKTTKGLIGGNLHGTGPSEETLKAAQEFFDELKRHDDSKLNMTHDYEKI